MNKLFVLAKILWLQALLTEKGMTLTYDLWRGKGKEWHIFKVKDD